MSDKIDLLGIKYSPSQIRGLHERFIAGDDLLGLIERMREQTKELLAQPDADGPQLYREQGAAIVLKKLLTLPEIVQSIVQGLPKE